jgi:hypothetical protein
MTSLRLASAFMLCMIAMLCHAQDDTRDKGIIMPDAFINAVNRQSVQTEEKLTRQSAKYLRKLLKQEKNLQKKLGKIDSAAAQAIFNLGDKYNTFLAKLKQKTAAARTGNYYIPLMDTLKTSLSFLEQNTNLPAGQAGLLTSTAKLSQLNGALSQLNNLQNKLNEAEAIRKFIKERKAFLQEQLSRFGMLKELKKFSKAAQYYHAQLEEYKMLLNEPDKLIAKSLGLLQKVPAFAEFFRKNSELASIFRLPGNRPIDPASLAGLQTRTSVMNQLQQRFGSAGVNPQQMLQQQIAGAQEQLSKLKDKLNALGGNSSDIEMPDYKINNQKTKSFWRRWEGSVTLDSKRSNGIFPALTNIGLSAGFKATDNIIIGGGLAGSVGWGENIRHIKMSWQGLAVRSYLEIKAKAGLFVVAAAEANYRRQIRDFIQLKDYSAWQKSALVGVTKKYSISKKLKGTLQLLYDFLAENQTPAAKPLVFRIGYSF